MRSLEMMIDECVSLEGRKFTCQVVNEIKSPEGHVGLVVEIDPPIPHPRVFRDKDYEVFVKSMFPNGVSKAIAFPKWQGVSLSPNLSENPTMIILYIPSCGDDWSWGKMHVAYWAMIKEDGPLTSDVILSWD